MPFSIGGGAGMVVSSVDPLELVLGEKVALCMVASREPSTWDTYKGPWARFERFCSVRSPARVSLPTLPMTVAMFLTLITQQASSCAVVKTSYAAIFAHHRMSLMENPCSHELVKAVRETAKRSIGLAVKNRKEPLDFSLVAAFAKRCLTSEGFLDRLTLTMMILGFCGFLRYSDLVRVFVDEIRFYDDYMEIFLETRKNDVLRYGNVIVIVRGEGPVCPVFWVQWLIGYSKLQGHVPLFQRYDGRVARFHPERVQDTYGRTTGDQKIEMPYHQCQGLVLNTLARLMSSTIAAVKAEFGTQSMRSGGASLVAAEGVTDRLFQRHGGWRSADCKNMYVSDTLEARLSVTRAILLPNGKEELSSVELHSASDEEFCDALSDF